MPRPLAATAGDLFDKPLADGAGSPKRAIRVQILGCGTSISRLHVEKFCRNRNKVPLKCIIPLDRNAQTKTGVRLGVGDFPLPKDHRWPRKIEN